VRGLLVGGCEGEYEGHGVGADAFLAAFEAEVLGGGGFDGYLSGVDAEEVGYGLPHLGDVGCHFGFLGHDDGVDIAYAVALGVEQLAGAAEEEFAVDVFVLGVVVGEVLADVAQGGGAEEGVADGVEQHVGVGVAEEAEGVGYFDASEPQFAVGSQLVYVVSYSYAHGVRRWVRLFAT